MFYLSRKKNVCLAGLLMISGAAMAADSVVEITQENAPVTTAEKPAPAVTEVATPEATEVATPEAAEVATPEAAEVATPKATKVVTPEATEVATPEATEVATPEATLPTAAATVTEPTVEPKESAKPAFKLDSEEQKRAYASGVMMARYVENQIAQQNTLHITLDKNIMLEGITDTFNAEGKMSDEDVQATLAAFDEQIKVLTQAQNDKKQSADKAFIDEFAKQPGVKKTSKGLYYLIEAKGDGAAIKDTNQVEIIYKGELIDGTVIDGPQVNNANEIFRVANMPPVLRDSVRLLRKGGRVKVVIPPAAVENTDGSNKPNMVVIYTISVVNVNNP